MMRTKLRNLGASRGVILPKPFVEELHLDGDEVELTFQTTSGGGQVVITKPAGRPREGWYAGGKREELAAEDAAWLDTNLLDPQDDEWSWDSIPGSEIEIAIRKLEAEPK